MSNKFVIREKTTNTFCTSTKNRFFADDLNESALFSSRANAEKAVKDMIRYLTKEVNIYGGNSWSVAIGTKTTVYQTFLQEYISLLEKDNAHLISSGWFNDRLKELKTTVVERVPELEVVEVRLTLV
jgi:hypothetical protein